MSKPSTRYKDPLVGATNEISWAISALNNLRIREDISDENLRDILDGQHAREHARAALQLLTKLLEAR